MATTGENSIKLQSLSDKHRTVASLLAQGLGRSEIAQIVEFTPEYVTWLTRDPLFKSYLQEMSEHVEARLEAMFGMTADVVADGMMNGNVEERLKAARLQLEVTGRIGKNERILAGNEASLERLEILAERLVSLNKQTLTQGVTINGQATRIEDAHAANAGTGQG